MKIIKTVLISICCVILMTQSAVSQWEMEITATGETGSAPNVFSIVIGECSTGSMVPAPPPPPQYMTYIQAWEANWASGPYLTMLYAAPADTTIWLLELDPNGNVMPPGARTTTLSWDTAELPAEGTFWIQDYVTGSVLVYDMRNQTSLEITSADDQYMNLYWARVNGIENGALTPEAYSVITNYPNPFNSETTILYELVVASVVKISIHDVKGRFVEELYSGWQSKGIHETRWNRGNASSGVYFCRIEAIHGTMKHKMVLLK